MQGLKNWAVSDDQQLPLQGNREQGLGVWTLPTVQEDLNKVKTRNPQNESPSLILASPCPVMGKWEERGSIALSASLHSGQDPALSL